MEMTTMTEEQARISQMIADTLLKIADERKRQQDIKLAPVTLVLTGLGAGAALFGAAIALLRYMGV